MENHPNQLFPLNQKNRAVLRASVLPSILLTGGILLLLSLVNLAFQYMDILTGVQSVERPPIMRFVLIEALAIVIAFSSFLYLTNKVRKDLSGGMKKSEHGKVLRKFRQRLNGKLVYRVKLDNRRVVDLDHQLFEMINEGEVLNIVMAPYSETIFEVSKLKG